MLRKSAIVYPLPGELILDVNGDKYVWFIVSVSDNNISQGYVLTFNKRNREFNFNMMSCVFSNKHVFIR